MKCYGTDTFPPSALGIEWEKVNYQREKYKYNSIKHLVRFEFVEFMVRVAVFMYQAK